MFQRAQEGVSCVGWPIPLSTTYDNTTAVRPAVVVRSGIIDRSKLCQKLVGPMFDLRFPKKDRLALPGRLSWSSDFCAARAITEMASILGKYRVFPA